MAIMVFIRYEVDPFNTAAFEQYARNWGQAIPRCSADLIRCYAPHEGSSTIAYGVYNIESLAADPAGRENYEFARKEKFLRREDRLFLRLASAPHAPLVRPYIVDGARSARQRFASRELRTAFPRKRVRPCTQTRPDFVDERPRLYR